MGQVCRKHEEFYEEACRWCEPEPDARIQTARDMIAKGLLYGVGAAAPAAPARCLYCAGLAAWVWIGVESGARTEMCQSHHNMQSRWQAHRLGDWTMARLP